MKLKYKAVLYDTPENTDCPFLSNKNKEEPNNSIPVDSVLLHKRCYQIADEYFFNQRGWMRGSTYHIEIEDEPRIIEG